MHHVVAPINAMSLAVCARSAEWLTLQQTQLATCAAPAYQFRNCLDTLLTFCALCTCPYMLL